MDKKTFTQIAMDAVDFRDSRDRELKRYAIIWLLDEHCHITRTHYRDIFDRFNMKELFLKECIMRFTYKITYAIENYKE